MIRRIIFDVVLVACVFFVPWWAVLVYAAAGVFFFRAFFEILLIGVVIDSLYNTAGSRLYGLEFFVTLISIIVFAAIEPLKRYVRLYKN